MKSLLINLLISVFLLYVQIFCYAQKCVRVLLDERTMNRDMHFDMQSAKGFVFISRARDAKKQNRHLYSHKNIIITCKQIGQRYHICINGHVFEKHQLYIAAKNGCIDFNGGSYQGAFLIVVRNDKMFVVNCIQLEDYLFSVLRTEGWPGWPLEVNKVLAIACRSYVLSMISEACTNKRLFHVKNTNHHQTYRGIHDHQYLRDAIEQTRGMYLSYNSKPIIAMFDSCCGGVIPAHIADINFVHAPYLARDYACSYCKSCKIYRWKVEFPIKAFEQALKDSLDGVQSITGLTIKKRDKAGLVKEIVLKGKPKDTVVSGQKIYSIFKEVKSFYFSITKKGKTILLSGRGFGHHRGMCQWGAREMVRLGWNYQGILEFYYPGAIFTKLN
jgi:stage II sporulation protein D